MVNLGNFVMFISFLFRVEKSMITYFCFFDREYTYVNIYTYSTLLVLFKRRQL